MPLSTGVPKCGSCKTIFPVYDLLLRHQREGCIERSRRFTAAIPSSSHRPHEKRLQLSPTSYVPLTLKLKKRTPEGAIEDRKRKIPGNFKTGDTPTGPPPPSASDTFVNDQSVPGQPSTMMDVESELGPSTNSRGIQTHGHLVDADPQRLEVDITMDRLPEPLASKATANVAGIKGVPNSFGLRRRYYKPSAPTHDPEEHITIHDLYDSEYHQTPVRSFDALQQSSTPTSTQSGGSVASPPASGGPQPPVQDTTSQPTFSQASDTQPAKNDQAASALKRGPEPPSPFGPFPNLSTFKLGEWSLTGTGQISLEKLRELSKIAQTPGFAQEVSKVDWERIFKRLGSDKQDLTEPKKRLDWMDDEGWKASPISIPVSLGAGEEVHHTVGTLYHRNVVSIVREKIASSPDANLFHFDPYKLLWQPNPESPPVRVYSELYTSDAFLRAHRELQDSPPPPSCTRPRVVVGLMFWSDETQVTQFGGTTKLWPCYMGFANESKHRRCKPTSDLFHQVAYFDDLSDEFKDSVSKRGQDKISAADFKALLTHWRGETMHGQWEVILDDELLDAIVNGLVIRCQDGVERRFYIRIFTYAADYKEKVLIATLRQNGHCPCPRCLVKQDDIKWLGTTADTKIRMKSRQDDDSRHALVQEARRLITQKGLRLGHTAVEELLFPQSLHPIEACLDPCCRFNIFSALVVDLLHEFEIGVFKRLFLHLLRILDAYGDEYLLHEIDRRYRLVPAFGRTIRRFSDNASETKRQAARDFEDLLQCAIPVFESVIPNPVYAKSITSILLVCAEWHALAKLRMHTDTTLRMLEDVTTALGKEFRKFDSDVCSHIRTEELANEVEARRRRAQKKADEEAKREEKERKKQEKEAEKAGGDAQKQAKVQTTGEGGGNRNNPPKPAKNSKKAGGSSQLPSSTLAEAPGGPQKRGIGRPRKQPQSSSQPSQITSTSAVSSSVKASETKAPNARKTAVVPMGRTSKVSVTQPSASKSGVLPMKPTPLPRREGLRSGSKPSTSNNAVQATAGPSLPSTSKQVAPAPIKRGRGRPKKTDPTCVPPDIPTSLGKGEGMPLPGSGERPPEEVSDEAVQDTPKLPTTSTQSSSSRGTTSDLSSFKPKLVEFNFATPKFHFLGDYASTIWLFGTTDSYSTQSGEAMHRFPKRWYKRTSKVNPRRGVLKYERKVGRVRELRKKLNAKESSELKSSPELQEQKAAAQEPNIHHHIGLSQNTSISLLSFAKLTETPGGGEGGDRDPLAVDFCSNLRAHLLPRVLTHIRAQRAKIQSNEGGPAMYPNSYPFSPSSIYLKDEHIYSHKLMRLKYTTYDVRRSEDVVHVDSDVCNIMVRNEKYISDRSEHPYRYGRVLGIYHANVCYTGEVAPGGVRYLVPHRLEFLWVRWYQVCPSEDHSSLPLVSFAPLAAPGSTSFLDPDLALRASHIIPRFHTGPLYENRRGLSEMAKDADDWKQYCVNRFVDRDMYMRYHIGSAVGHHGLWPEHVNSDFLPAFVHSGQTPEAGDDDVSADASTSKKVLTSGGEGDQHDEDSDMEVDPECVDQEEEEEEQGEQAQEERERDYLMHGPE